MTIRIRPSAQQAVDSKQLTALITQSLLLPSNDDAPGAAKRVASGSWLSWSGGLAALKQLAD